MLSLRSAVTRFRSIQKFQATPFFNTRLYASNESAKTNVEGKEKPNDPNQEKEEKERQKENEEAEKKEARYQALMDAHPTTKSIVFFIDILTSKYKVRQKS